jgi:uncharacterized radical SAM superfamily Fe-S cluster-containing enzyme
MGDTGVRVIKKVDSLCPVCLKVIGASVVARGDEVFLEKTCEGHGRWSVPIWRGEPRYEDWTRPKDPVHPEVLYGRVEKEKGCPYDCGLCASHRQYPCSVLLEVTDRCNLTCPVCFADTPRDRRNVGEPTRSTIAWWYDRVMQAAGPCNIQLSGGEPTLRDDLPEIVALGVEKGFSFIQVNTNGLVMAQKPDYAGMLRDGGLSTVFLQFDGTDDGIYRELRGRPLMREKMAAIEHCAAAGLGVILVPTLAAGINTGNIGSMVRFAVKNSPVVRGIHFQPLSHFGRYPAAAYASLRFTLPEVIRAIEEQAGDIAEKWNFLPPGTENDHCSFHGSFIVMPGGKLKCTSPSASACCGNRDGREGLLRTISTVARQWSPGGVCCQPVGGAERHAGEPTESRFSDGDVIDLDTFLQRGRDYGFSISCMAFQDVWNLDIERLRDCCISIMSPDGRLIPFCAYNLTSETGKTLYRGRCHEKDAPR